MEVYKCIRGYMKLYESIRLYMDIYDGTWKRPGRCVSGAFEVRTAVVVGGGAPGAVRRRAN